MTLKRRFGNSRFADSYLPYGLFVLISLISLALAGCSGASPRAVVPEPTTATPVTPEAPQPSTESTVTILADSDTVEAGQLVSYTVNASPAPTADLTVHVAYTGVELAAEPPPATITIDAGSGAAMLTVQTAEGPGGTITASVIEGDGYTVGPAASALVTVTASPTDGGSTTGTTGPVIPGTVIIRPPPPANSVTITAVTDSVVEGEPVRFRVTAAPAPAEPLTLGLSVTVTGPTRTTGNFPTSVTIPASSTSMELTLTTTNNTVAESAGTVTARLTGVTSGPAAYSIGSPVSATVTVTDDDAPLQNSVIISAVRASVVEGDPVRFRVTAAPAPAEPLTLGLSVTVTGPTRTTGNFPTSVTIPPLSTSKELTLTTTNNTVAESAGTVTARLTGVTSGPAAYSIGSPASATVTVTDNDQDEAPRAAPSVLRSLQVIYGGFGYLNQEVTLSWQDPLHWRTARGTRGYQYRTVVVGTMSEWRSVTSSGGGPQSASIPVSVRGWVEYEMRAIQGGVVGPEASAGIVFIEAAPGSDTVTVSLLRVRRAPSQLRDDKPYTYEVEFYLDEDEVPDGDGDAVAFYYLYNDRGCTQFNTSSTTTLTETPSPTGPGRNQVLIFFNGPDLGEAGVRVAKIASYSGSGNNRRANPAKFGECVGAGLTTW